MQGHYRVEQRCDEMEFAGRNSVWQKDAAVAGGHFSQAAAFLGYDTQAEHVLVPVLLYIRPAAVVHVVAVADQVVAGCFVVVVVAISEVAVDTAAAVLVVFHRSALRNVPNPKVRQNRAQMRPGYLSLEQ